MGDIAHADEAILYKLIGVDAEYLIDHAWGREPTTIAEIKAYRPKESSLSTVQVLMTDYSYDDGLLILKEMVDLLCLDLVDKNLVTNSLSLYVGYAQKGAKSSRGSVTMPVTTNSVKVITKHFAQLYENIVNRLVPIRRIGISFNKLVDEAYEQYDLFTDPAELQKDRDVQLAVLNIKKKFGNNAILKGMDLQKAATTLERNRQIGGHKSGEQ